MIAEKCYHLGLIGYQLGHSVSPAIHQAALSEFGLQGSYQLFSASPSPQGKDEIATILENVRIGILDGVNVTIPHKRSVLPFLDELSDIAKNIQAVNTIYLSDNKLIGDNTDVGGLIADLHQIKPSYDKALVLGAGGAARAAVYALVKSGCVVWIHARRIEQARILLHDMQSCGKNFEWNLFVLNEMQSPIQSVIDRCDLIINATPSGMFPNINESAWIKGISFPKDAILYDMIYNPLDTLLMRQARESGLTTVNGLGMLVRQAALAFERWTGRKPTFERLYQAAEAALIAVSSSVKEG